MNFPNRTLELKTVFISRGSSSCTSQLGPRTLVFLSLGDSARRETLLQPSALLGCVSPAVDFPSLRPLHVSGGAGLAPLLAAHTRAFRCSLFGDCPSPPFPTPAGPALPRRPPAQHTYTAASLRHLFSPLPEISPPRPAVPLSSRRPRVRAETSPASPARNQASGGDSPERVGEGGRCGAEWAHSNLGATARSWPAPCALG